MARSAPPSTRLPTKVSTAPISTITMMISIRLMPRWWARDETPELERGLRIFVSALKDCDRYAPPVQSGSRRLAIMYAGILPPVPGTGVRKSVAIAPAHSLQYRTPITRAPFNLPIQQTGNPRHTNKTPPACPHLLQTYFSMGCGGFP